MPSPTSQLATNAGERPEAPIAVGYWLVAVCALLIAMVLVGGATRLTDSGLSITEWRPVTGAVPPLSDAGWLDEFEKYKQIPEYREVNEGMSLTAFKTIYWWEWGHRFLGRVIGLAFFIPLAIFWITGRLPRALKPRLVLLLAMGGAQGALGWFMVKSGLTERVDVSQYRLAAHLSLAFAILGLMWWTALDVLRGAAASPWRFERSFLTLTVVLVALAYLQIALGGFVAGLKAGLTFNTWPLMDGGIAPPGYWDLSPWYTNFFENYGAVQFNHRLGAYALLALAWLVAWRAMRAPASPQTKRWAGGAAAAVTLQAILGIWTLLAVSPLALALPHQGGAIVVFLLSIGLAHQAALERGPRAAVEPSAAAPQPASA